MPVEIERKFLLSSDKWRDEVVRSSHIRQGYMGVIDKASVRIRIQGGRANINIKSATLEIRRMEYEYEIPLDEAVEMLDELCNQPQIDKTRYIVKRDGHVWEIDEFHGDNQGLLVAEVELEIEDEAIIKPDWLGDEVTADSRYYNVSLIKHPFKVW